MGDLIPFTERFPEPFVHPVRFACRRCGTAWTIHCVNGASVPSARFYVCPGCRKLSGGIERLEALIADEQRLPLEEAM